VALVNSLDTPRKLAKGTIPSAVLLRMVLDGLLEVELGGRFHSGGAAHRRLFTPPRTLATRSRILQLSKDALAFAALVASRQAHELADRLYHYNTLPRSPEWLRRCPDDAAASEFLTPTSGSTETHSVIVGPWRVWDTSRPELLRDRGIAPTYKLYISVTPSSSRTATTALLETLGRRDGPFSCKLGQDMASVLRPDRLVAYFNAPASLRATAERLKHRLIGMPAHGVPFTAPLEPTGVLSWGVDFAYTGELGSHLRERSWRGWVTSRLATALVNADRSGAVDRVAFALDRVALDGVQIGSWTPSSALLRRHGAGAVDVAA
jgi:hypothetical protein